MVSSSEMMIRNIEVLKQRVNQYGIYGLIIALATIAIASSLVSYQMTGKINLDSFIAAQDSNIALRFLDFLPFVFAFWGQYVGTIMASQASTIIVEQTNELRTETTEWKRKSMHGATHDALTNIPNRALFYDQLRQLILVASREQKTIAVLFIDLDGFKEINDTFGKHSGDLILIHLVARLQRIVQSNDTIARMGGDEFALSLMGDRSENDAVSIINQIHKILKSPFEISDSSIEIGTSIGLSLFPDNGEDADSLIQRAEVAMHVAKHTQDGYVAYSSDQDQDNPRRIMLMSELRYAIDNNQLELHYQPKIGMQTGKIISVEVLVRWKHSEHGHISPAEFIPLAERTRLMKPLTNWIITNSLHEYAKWQNSGLTIGMAINISARDLSDPEFPDKFAELLATYEVKPVSLTLEITESSVMDDPRRTLEVLNRLSDMHLSLSIDDFGTGYSSLAYLSKLPVKEIKIDQTFVMNMTENKNDALIVKSTIDLGHNLGLNVIAEGVEDKETWRMLEQMGCDIAQGYYMSPPLRKPELLKWLQESRWGSKTSGQVTDKSH